VTENHIPTLMITHNMKDAIKYGNRLIMMNAGKIIFEASGEEKQKLTVEDLVEKFAKAGDEDLPDAMVLG
jgi:putative ABC transport system ATP-binding protein